MVKVNTKTSTVSAFLIMAIVVILAIAFISSIATQTSTVTTKTAVEDEAYNLQTIGCYIQDGYVNK